MVNAIVGRTKKPAARRNYKIAYELLAKLNAISVLEDRSDTAQLERWIRESAERWEQANPESLEEYQQLYQAKLDELVGDD